jgi:hypothetical protein
LRHYLGYPLTPEQYRRVQRIMTAHEAGRPLPAYLLRRRAGTSCATGIVICVCDVAR